MLIVASLFAPSESSSAWPRLARGREMLRVLVSLVRHKTAQRILHDEAPESSFGITRASEDTPHEHSPETLSARLDAVERLLEERQALHRIQVAGTIAHLTKKDD